MKTPALTFRSPSDDDLSRARDPGTASAQLSAYACDLRMGVRRAAASNPNTPRELLELLQRAGSSPDLTRMTARHAVLSAEEVAELSQLGPWAEQLAARQRHADPLVLNRLAEVKRPAVRRLVAQHRQVSSETLSRLLLDRDESVRATAATHGMAPQQLKRIIAEVEARSTPVKPPQLDELARIGSWGRILAAGHPSTGRVLLERLSKDTDWRVRAAIVDHPAARADMLEPLLSLGSPEIDVKLAGHTNTPAGTLESLAFRQDLSTRLAVADNVNTPAAVLSRLLWDGGERVRHAALTNPNTPADAIEILQKAEAGSPLPEQVLGQLSESGPWARRLAALHPSTPTGALHRLAADADPFIREQVYRRETVPAVLLRLGSAPDLQGAAAPDTELTPDEIHTAITLGPWARILAARHPNTPPAMLVELAGDEYWQARRAVARHPATPDAALVTLSGDAVADVRWSLVRRAGMPADVLRNLVTDEFAAIRVAVAQHQDTPMEFRHQLALDRDEDVRDAAKAAISPG